MTKARLIGNWCLDDGRGQIAKDTSPYQNHGQLGTLYPTNAPLPAWISGRNLSTLALRFDGENFVKVANHVVYETRPTVTVEAWVRSSDPGSPFGYIVSKGADRCIASSYGLYTGETMGLFFYIYQGPTASFILSPDAGITVWDDLWHHVAGTFDGRVVQLYVDGQQIEMGTVPATPVTIAYDLPSRDIHIGAYIDDCQLGFSGDIADVHIWDDALSVEEIWKRAQGQEL